MLKRFLLSCSLAATFAVGADWPQFVSYQAENLTPGNIRPLYDNGYLVVWGLGNASVYTPEGSLAYVIPGPGKGRSMTNVAVDTDRTAVVAVHDSERGGLSIFGPTGAPVGFIDTDRFQPAYVAFAPDHSIWTTGGYEPHSRDDQPDYFMLRHFSRDGKELGAFLLRSAFGSEAVSRAIGRSDLRIANNRIGALLSYLGHRDEALWVETDLEGKELGRWKTRSIWPVAFTSSGALYGEGESGIFEFDRAASQWKPVSISAPGRLLAADGESLVFVTRGALQRVPVNR